jgi:hypothetical protein
MKHDLILAHWNRLGIMFNIQPAEQTADIEKLLVETASIVGQNARLLSAVASWLCRYHRLVCRHRFAKFVSEIKSQETLATLGFMLSCVKNKTSTGHFNVVIKHCKKLETPLPLFCVDRKSKSLALLAKSNSCDLAKQWGLWCDKVEFKDDIIRKSQLVIKQNPTLKYRALFGGQLKASVLETIAHCPQSADSEVALTKACGVTRKALREAVEHLEFCLIVRRSYTAGKIKISLSYSDVNDLTSV